MISFRHACAIAVCAVPLCAAQPAGGQQRRLPALQPTDSVPALTVGFPAADSFAFTVPGAAFEAAVPIQAGDKGGAFAVRVSPLRSANGGVVPVTMWLDDGSARDTLGTRVQISPAGSVDLNLRARLPSPGVYRGAFVIQTKNSTLSRTYTVSWTKRTNQPLQVTGAGAVAATVGGGRVVIPFALHDTGGAGVLVYRPALDEIRQQVRADTSLAVPHGAISVRVPGIARDLDGITLEPNGSRELELIVPDAIRGAGVYTANLRIAGPDLQPVSVPLKIYARRGAWVALGIILLGIALAELIRYLRDNVRPRLDRRRRAATYLEALNQLTEQMASGGTLPDEERTLVDRIRARLFKLYSDHPATATADADAALADLARRLTLLPEWVNVRRAIEAAPRRLQVDLRAKLAPVAAYLLGADTRDEAALTTARDQLQNIPREITTAVQKDIQSRTDEFLARLAEELTANANDPGLLSKLGEVKSRIQSARQLAVDGALSQAQDEFDAARFQYVDLLTRRLRSLLDQATPGWMEPDDWTQLRTEVSAELDRGTAAASPEEKLQAYRKAQELYLRKYAGSLETVARALAQTANKDTEKKALSQAVEVATSAQAKAAVGELRGAEEDLRRATEAWNEYDKERRIGLGKEATGAPAAVPGFTWAPGALQLGATPRTVGSLVLPVSEEGLASQIARLDFGLGLVAAALALFLGFYLLWDPDLTWGTNADMFAALLWGLGLQQAGHETFKGVANLVGSIGGGRQQGGSNAAP